MVSVDGAGGWMGPCASSAGEGGAALYERDDNATSSPPSFHQWKQAITRYPFTSLMGFSALFRCAVMEQPLVKIHMAGCLKISANRPPHPLPSAPLSIFRPFSHHGNSGKSVWLFRCPCKGSSHNARKCARILYHQVNAQSLVRLHIL